MLAETVPRREQEDDTDLTLSGACVRPLSGAVPAEQDENGRGVVGKEREESKGLGDGDGAEPG